MVVTHQIIIPPNAAVSIHFRRQSTNNRSFVCCNDKNLTTPVAKFRAVGSSARLLQDHHPTVDVGQMVNFLLDDLPHVFDDRGIDRTVYDEGVKFRDPITKYDSISGYLFNISALKNIFMPDLVLHWVKQTGPYEITTRWTMIMKLMMPWKPELVFTGTSVMTINPATAKFCTISDSWDSIDNNEYFSLEGLLDVFKQVFYYKTPDLETPKYQILKRTAIYEVRKYDRFIAVEGRGNELSDRFNNVTGLQNPQKGTAAVIEFNGKPTEEVVRQNEKFLRKSLVKNGLKPINGYLLVDRYNNNYPRAKSFIMRNEVLIWLEKFAME